MTTYDHRTSAPLPGGPCSHGIQTRRGVRKIRNQTAIRYAGAIAVVSIAWTAPSGAALTASCSDLDGFVCTEEGLCSELSSSEKEDACWDFSLSNAILNEEPEWYETNCVVQAGSCMSGISECIPYSGSDEGFTCYYNH